MRRLSSCLVLLLTAGLRADDGVKTETADGKAEIMFPAKPVEKGGATNKQFILERDGGKAALLLQYNNLPKEADITNADAVKTVLDRGRDSLKNAFKGAKIAAEKDFKFADKYPARDIDAEVPGLGTYRTRFILTGSKFYQVTMLGSTDYLGGKEAKAFWDSFKLKD